MAKRKRLPSFRERVLSMMTGTSKEATVCYLCGERASQYMQHGTVPPIFPLPFAQHTTPFAMMPEPQTLPVCYECCAIIKQFLGDNTASVTSELDDVDAGDLVEDIEKFLRKQNGDSAGI